MALYLDNALFFLTIFSVPGVESGWATSKGVFVCFVLFFGVLQESITKRENILGKMIMVQGFISPVPKPQKRKKQNKNFKKWSVSVLAKVIGFKNHERKVIFKYVISAKTFRKFRCIIEASVSTHFFNSSTKQGSYPTKEMHKEYLDIIGEKFKFILLQYVKHSRYCIGQRKNRRLVE